MNKTPAKTYNHLREKASLAGVPSTDSKKEAPESLIWFGGFLFGPLLSVCALIVWGEGHSFGFGGVDSDTLASNKILKNPGVVRTRWVSGSTKRWTK